MFTVVGRLCKPSICATKKNHLKLPIQHFPTGKDLAHMPMGLYHSIVAVKGSIYPVLFNLQSLNNCGISFY